MEVEIWDGGLQEQEVAAIEKIKAAFSGSVNAPNPGPISTKFSFGSGFITSTI